MEFDNTNLEYQKIYTYEELKKIFPFGKTKLGQLCRAGVLPVIKVGRTYISTPELVDEWFRDHAGR